MNTKSYLFRREPDWHEHRRGSQHYLPETVQSWAYETGSLTQRLRDYYGNRIAVTLLFHDWRKPYLGESKHLHLRSGRYGLIREVMLHIDGKPLILARTVIPEETIKVAHRNLAHLGTRPLGEVIFSYPKLERLTMDLSLTQPGIWMQQVKQTAGITLPIWGRRTVYAIHNRPLLVSEFFMPEVLSY
ncbi:MAG: chorismate lyase [Methylococcaceae bacterium]|nr:chorismate lyase [Methylococcaceae bacterium]